MIIMKDSRNCPLTSPNHILTDKVWFKFDDKGQCRPSPSTADTHRFRSDGAIKIEVNEGRFGCSERWIRLLSWREDKQQERGALRPQL